MANQKIPVLDLRPEIDLLWDELNTEIQSVLRSTQFIMGPQVAELENELADYLGVKHVVGLNSGTDALVLGLRSMGIGAGDEVITTSFTFFATAEAINMVGATPVFVDIDPQTFNLNADQIEAHINERTRVILPVHLFGQAADMGAIMSLAEKYNLKVLEDTAQAFGGTYKDRKLGAIGEVGAFSCYPTKNLGAYGDAGFVTTNDDASAEMMGMLRKHGAKKKYHNEMFGYNSRLDTFQAAIMRVKLPHVDEWNGCRQEAAATYDELLADVPGVVAPHVVTGGAHIYHQYTVRILSGRRDAVRERLTAMGVGTMIYYPIPIHQLPVYTELEVSLPHTEQAALEVLSLPIWPQITRETQGQVVDALRTALT